jgi:hypothetical protein
VRARRSAIPARRLERFGDVLVDAVDHRRGHVEQRELVDVLHFARLQHRLLAIANFDTLLLQSEKHRRLDHVHPERQSATPRPAGST